MDAELKSGLAPTARFCRGFVPAADGDWDLRLACGACRVSPRRATFCSLLRQRKEGKRKASRIRRPAARARCDARRSRGLAKLASLKQRQPLSGCTCASRLLITAWEPKTRSKNQDPQGRAMARPCGLGFWRLDFASGLHPLYAPSSAAESGSGRTLFERSEFRPTPLAASSAGCPQRSVGTQTVGSPSLGLLSLGDARESECAVGRTSRQSPAGHAKRPTPERESRRKTRHE